MSKKVRRTIFISTIITVIAIIAIYVWYISVSTVKDETVMRIYTENNDKFENIHSYLSKNYSLAACNKSIIGRKIEFHGSKLNKNKGTKTEDTQIDDEIVLQQIEYILYDLDFKRIEIIGDHAIFVLRDGNDHFQAIDYDNYDLTKIKDWNGIRLKDNWYYRSYLISSVDADRPPDE